MIIPSLHHPPSTLHELHCKIMLIVSIYWSHFKNDDNNVGIHCVQRCDVNKVGHVMLVWTSIYTTPERILKELLNILHYICNKCGAIDLQSFKCSKQYPLHLPSLHSKLPQQIEQISSKILCICCLQTD